MRLFLFLTLLLSSAFSSPLFAADCAVEITGNDQIQYDKKSIAVDSSCEQFTVTLKHIGKLPMQAMGHNWTLTATGDSQAVAQAGMTAGLDNDYLPPDDARIIAHTDIIGGGESSTITLDVSKLEKGGDYTFFCSFPGHSALMNGKLVVQ